MNLIQWLGMTALMVGASVFISMLLFGHDRLIEFTGAPLGPLYGGCAAAIVVGMVAFVLGLQEQREFHSLKRRKTMKNRLALLVPILMLLFGAYALFTTLGSSGEQVTLISDHALPRGLAMMLGAIGLAGGALVMVTMLNGKKPAA